MRTIVVVAVLCACALGVVGVPEVVAGSWCGDLECAPNCQGCQSVCYTWNEQGHITGRIFYNCD